MSVIGELLFYTGSRGASLNDAIRNQMENILPQRVQKITQKDIAQDGIEAVVEKIALELEIEPIILDTANSTSDIKEISMTGTNHWGESYKASGLRITKQFPFSGDGELFKVYAGSFSMSPPRGEVNKRQQTIVLGMEVPADRKQVAIDHIKSTLSEILNYIEQQAGSITAYNDSLRDVVATAVLARHKKLEEIDNLKKSLDEI